MPRRARMIAVVGLVMCVAGGAGLVAGTSAPAMTPEAETAGGAGIWLSALDHTRPFAIKGRLLVNAARWVDGETQLRTYFVEERSDNIVPASTRFVDGDLSPISDEVVYGDASPRYPPHTRRIFRGNLDGSDKIDLTARAGLSGVNCMAAWSHDGKMIAFQHSEPEPGQHPCQAGFTIWVMGADGSNPRPIEPQGVRLEMLRFPRWSPLGDRISTDGNGLDIIMDIDGGNVETLMPTRGGVDWSPDGALIASAGYLWGSLDGKRGVWRQLVVARPDGSEKKVLLKHFVALADVKRHVERIAAEGEQAVLSSQIQWEIGPRFPRWSPDGSQIAFLAGMPFDADGPSYRKQVEAWIYDLPSGRLTRVTNDDDEQTWLSWR